MLLDPQTTESILSLLKEINEKLDITIVVITHQMSVITDICTRVAIIENGRLVEEGPVEEVFDSPKTDIARELIANKQSTYSPVESLKSNKVIRIVFSENSSFEPVVANLILKFNTPVNIMGADTRNVGGKAKGEMLLGLPDDEDIQRSMIAYLKDRGLSVSEVREGV